MESGSRRSSDNSRPTAVVSVVLRKSDGLGRSIWNADREPRILDEQLRICSVAGHILLLVDGLRGGGISRTEECLYQDKIRGVAHHAVVGGTLFNVGHDRRKKGYSSIDCPHISIEARQKTIVSVSEMLRGEDDLPDVVLAFHPVRGF